MAGTQPALEPELTGTNINTNHVVIVSLSPSRSILNDIHTSLALGTNEHAQYNKNKSTVNN